MRLPSGPQQPIRLPEAANLPVYLTELVGRDREVVELRELLTRARLVSLVGAGGAGKTRLAAAVAESHRDLSAVAWIDLTLLSDPELVAPNIAAILGLREQVGRTAVASLLDMLVTDPVLIVLDNCEHILGACARLVDTLLRGCPLLRVLTTSRQALGVAGERVWPVPPLALPDPGSDSPGDAEAVRLFVRRAQDALPNFVLTPANVPTVVEICRRLDGLPLAIELAAARVRLLPPEQLARRLDSMLGLLSSTSQLTLPRHRTLRAVIDWSHSLLSPEERLLMRRLAVFSGGFTLDAAEVVVGCEPLSPDQVLDLLGSLLDRSLVIVTEDGGAARYALPETVRQYAEERLAEAEDRDALRGRHAEHFLELAEAAEPHILGGTRGTPWMRRLEQEQANLWAAMAWCAQPGDRVEMDLRFGVALHWFHFASSRFKELRGRLEDALARSGEAPTLLRGRALAALGYLAFWMGEPAEAQAPLRESVGLLREHGLPTDRAFALTGLAATVGLGGDRTSADPLFEEAEVALGDPARFAEDDFPRALLFAFQSYWRGTVAQASGDLPEARARFEISVGVARRFGSHPSIAHPLTALARTLTLQGELDTARGCLTEALPLHAGNEDRWGLLQAVEVAALLMARRNRAGAAARLLGAADRIRVQIGARHAPHEQAERQRLVESIRDGSTSGAFERDHAEGATLSTQEILREVTEAPVEAADLVGRKGAWTGPVGSAPPASADLRVRTLGPLQLFLGERPLGGDAFASSKPRELLLLLLCHPEGRTREQVGLAFWPESSTAHVKNSFHVTLHRLRKALEHPDWIIAAGDRYRLDPALTVDFDAERFRAEVEPLVGRSLTATTAERLRGALTLYGGDFLEGETVGDWHLALRDRLRRLYVDAQLTMGRFEIGAGNTEAAADAFRAVLARDRLHEEACRELMVCLVRLGARAEALRIFDGLRLLLREELGMEPEPGTVALYEEVRSDRQALEVPPRSSS